MILTTHTVNLELDWLAQTYIAKTNRDFLQRIKQLVNEKIECGSWDNYWTCSHSAVNLLVDFYVPNESSRICDST